MIKPLVYTVSTGSPVEIPFERFLPLEPPGMVDHWLKRETPPGSTILDPLGSSPRAIIEAANAGYRVLVASNNPVIAFETRLLASKPEKAAFISVFRELSDQKRVTSAWKIRSWNNTSPAAQVVEKRFRQARFFGIAAKVCRTPGSTRVRIVETMASIPSQMRTSNACKESNAANPCTVRAPYPA